MINVKPKTEWIGRFLAIFNYPGYLFGVLLTIIHDLLLRLFYTLSLILCLMAFMWNRLSLATLSLCTNR